MKKDIFLKATRFDDAFTTLQKFARPIEESERIPIKDSLNRVLSNDLRSPINVPHFERASRDGYALKSVDTFGAREDNPVSLRLMGEIRMGLKSLISLSKGECAKISTGAMLPKGADSISMVEYTEEEDGIVKVHRPTSPGENIIKVGTDIKAGDVVLRKDRKLSVFDAGILASLGLSEVGVYRKPKASIISTGDELLDQGQQLETGKVYEVNSVTIHQAVLDSGSTPTDVGIVPDDSARIVRALDSALASSDVVLVSGGTSKGAGDLMPQVIDKLGKPDFLIHGIAMKPGKPTILSSFNSRLLMTLPGYPTSALIVYYTLVDPAIRKMSHWKPSSLRRLRAYTSKRVYSEIGRKEFKPCVVSKGNNGRIYATPVPTGSEAITTLASADGYMIIDEDTEFIDEDQEVEICIFPHRLEDIGRLVGETH